MKIAVYAAENINKKIGVHNNDEYILHYVINVIKGHKMIFYDIYELCNKI